MNIYKKQSSKIIVFLFALSLFLNTATAFAATNIGTDISTGNLTVNGALNYVTGAVANYILTTDGAGNATWTPVGTALGSATADDLPAGITNTYYDPLREGAANGLATLDGGGQIPAGQIPALAINQTYVVATIAARSALTPNTGDVVIVTDAGSGESRSYIWDGASWIELLTPLQLYLAKSNNLSELTNPSTARDNLNLGTGNSPSFTGLTLSGITLGSMLFGGAGGAVSQDNANLFWDNVNKRLGIGTNVPLYALDVNGDIRAGAGSRLFLGTKADPDPAGTNGAMYYNTTSNKFRCHVAGSWGDCDTTGGTTTLQSAYNNGAVINTGGADIAFTLNTPDAFTASGTGAVNLTPTGASSFTSGGALTLTGGAASTWSTTAGALDIDSAAGLNLGTTNATGVSIGKTSTITTVNGPLAIPEYADFTSSGNPAHAEGRVFYDDGEKSLAYYNDLTGTTVNIGQESRVRVYNNTGSPIPDGKAVYINGANGDIPTIDLAKADNQSTARAIGVTTTTLANNAYGDVNTMGVVHDLDTSAYSTGDHLYLSDSTAGGFTTTKPSAPSLAVPIGYVVKSDATTGIIFVTPAGYFSGTLSAGGIVYGSSSGETTDDPLNLFWDETNKRLGIGDNNPSASLVVGAGGLFQVFGGSGNVTTQGDITLTTGGGTITSVDGDLILTTTGALPYDIKLQPDGAGTSGNVQIGEGGAGSATPDFLALDIKNSTGDPVGGFEGAMYYNTTDNKFRCFEGVAWKDCDGSSSQSLQNSYDSGATGAIVTSAGRDIALTLNATGNFTATGAGSVNLNPAGASSLSSTGGALTLTGGATSTWSTSTGDLNITGAGALNLLGATASGFSTTAGAITLQPKGAANTELVKIGVGGLGSATPDLLALDVMDVANGAGVDPSGGVNGAMYYNDFSDKFRCFINGSWGDCDTTGGTTTLQSAYNNGAAIITAGSTDIALTLASGNLTATGAGSVNLNPAGASSLSSTGGALTLTGGAASTWGTSAGDLTLQVAGSGTSGQLHVGSGTASTTPDLLALDVLDASGNELSLPGSNGYMYYSNITNSFRCYEAGGWKDCGATAASATDLNQAYTAGSTITTSGTPITFNLTSGGFNVTDSTPTNLLSITDTGAVNLTPTGALTLTAGAASTWGTTAGNVNLVVNGAGTGNVQIGDGAGSATPDFLALDIKNSTGDPAEGFEGAMYYNTTDNKFRCFENTAWKDCDTTGTAAANSLDFTEFDDSMELDASTTIDLNNFNLTTNGTGNYLVDNTGTAGITPSGVLTLDSDAGVNVGTTSATGVSIGKAATTAAVNGALSVAEYIDVNTSSNPAYDEGRLFYDQGLKSLSYYNDHSAVTVDIGQKNILRVKNSSGGSISFGNLVYVSGATAGGIPTVGLAKADSFSTSKVLGFAAENIAAGAEGYVTAFGMIVNLDTSAFTPGDPIYLSATTAGAFTATKPLQPNYAVPVGYIGKQDAATGTVLAFVVPKLDTSLVTGELGFADASGNLIGDAVNLFWDNTSKRLGIGDNTPGKTLTIGNGTPGSNMFGVEGSTGNVTTQGDITLSTGGGTITSTEGGLNLTSGGASTYSTTSGNITLQPAGSGVTANVQIGAGTPGNFTPDLLVLDMKSDAEGFFAGTEGAMYYNDNTNKFRCFEGTAWKDCDTTGTAAANSLDFTEFKDSMKLDADTTIDLNNSDLTTNGTGDYLVNNTGTAGLTPSGALTLDSSAAVNLGTTNSTSVSIGRSAGGAIGLTTPSGVNLNPYGGGAGNTSELRFLELLATGTNYVGFKAPDLIGTNKVWTLPAVDGTSGQVLSTNGSGILSWITGSMPIGTASDSTIRFNGTSWLENTNFNASSAGTLTIAADQSYTGAGAVTLSSGAVSALTITSNAASTYSTTAGNLTLQAGSGTVSLGTSTNLTAAGALTIDSNTTSALNFGTGANAKTITIGNSTGATALILDAGTGGVKIGDSTATPITRHLSATTSFDLANTSACVNSPPITVTGAAPGDTVIATPTPITGGIENVNMIWSAYVSAPNTVIVRACAVTNNQNAASQTWRIDVWQH